MRSGTYHLSIGTARADALFASALQRSDEPSAAQARQAIAAAIRAFGARGCAARVAQAYGEHPETAVLRMRWARAVVKEDADAVEAFGGARPEPARAGSSRQPSEPGRRAGFGTYRAALSAPAAVGDPGRWRAVPPA
jgi:hypothetical protein